MKKFKLSLILILCLILSICPNANAKSSEVYGWYCVRAKDHKSPILPNDLEFIEKYNAYYKDNEHSSYLDREKVIYLTFDAGYENGNVERILDILKEENVCATFFVLGHFIEQNTDLVIRMNNEGHLVGNHTFSHKNMSKANGEELIKELNMLEALYYEKTGCIMKKFYRPPEGNFSEENLKVLSSEGYATIFWSFAYEDWDNNKQPTKENALNKMKNNLHNGEIMLLHPTSQTNAEVLSSFIKFAKSEGFRFACAEELIRS